MKTFVWTKPPEDYLLEKNHGTDDGRDERAKDEVRGRRKSTERWMCISRG